MPLSEALRQAKLSLLNDKMQPELRHPYYWAAFVLEGDPFLRFRFQ
ncbi:MAG: CHAT domain-containing protein [Bacteroidia bacterium]|nr:CHAT domain-containing protein [Bacteroidia bacterium]